jgi:transposase-like protein
VRVAGGWTYLYRAVDSSGATIDFFLSETRDVSAARTFFHKALAAPNHPRPRLINVDGNPSYPNVIDELERNHALGQRLGALICNRAIVTGLSPRRSSVAVAPYRLVEG